MCTGSEKFFKMCESNEVRGNVGNKCGRNIQDKQQEKSQNSTKMTPGLCVTAGLDLPSVRVRTGRSGSCCHRYGEDHYPYI